GVGRDPGAAGAHSLSHETAHERAQDIVRTRRRPSWKRDPLDELPGRDGTKGPVAVAFEPDERRAPEVTGVVDGVAGTGPEIGVQPPLLAGFPASDQCGATAHGDGEGAMTIEP